MQDLQEVTHEIHYENYRFEKLQLQKFHEQDEKQKKLIQEKDNEVNLASMFLSFRFHFRSF